MKLRRLAAGSVLVLSASAFLTAPASSQEECTGVSVTPGVILITSAPSFGPMVASVPAGTYRMIVRSYDLGHSAGRQTDQMHEQWSFSADTGYTSPRTPDLGDALTVATYDLGEVTLTSAVSSISFRQWGVAPSVDSVRPEITFQRVQGPVTTTEAPTTTVTPRCLALVPVPTPRGVVWAQKLRTRKGPGFRRGPFC
jgi:hypothetical protein